MHFNARADPHKIECQIGSLLSGEKESHNASSIILPCCHALWCMRLWDHVCLYSKIPLEVYCNMYIIGTPSTFEYFFKSVWHMCQKCVIQLNHFVVLSGLQHVK